MCSRQCCHRKHRGLYPHRGCNVLTSLVQLHSYSICGWGWSRGNGVGWGPAKASVTPPHAGVIDTFPCSRPDAPQRKPGQRFCSVKCFEMVMSGDGNPAGNFQQGSGSQCCSPAPHLGPLQPSLHPQLCPGGALGAFQKGRYTQRHLMAKQCNTG